MAIPRAVQAAADAADAKLKQMGTPPVEAPKPPETPAVPPVAVVEDPPKPPVEDFKQQYSVLLGKYNAEVPRLHDELKQTKENITKLQTQIAELAVKPPEPEKPQESLLDTMPRELKDLMDEFPEPGKMWAYVLQQLDAIRNQPADTAPTEYDARLENLEKKTEDGDKLTYENYLTTLVPDWRVVDHDENFIKWLNERDGLSPYTRHDFLSEAHQKHDASTVAHYFNTWKAEQGAKNAPTPPPVEDPRLQEQQQPTGQGGSAPTADPGKKIYTLADIKQHYDSMLSKRVTDMDAWTRRDKDILQAQAEGRIRA